MEHMPFGKYKGEEFVDIPSGYLTWILEQDDIVEKNPELIEAVEDMMAMRDRSDAHFYD